MWFVIITMKRHVAIAYFEIHSFNSILRNYALTFSSSRWEMFEDLCIYTNTCETDRGMSICCIINALLFTQCTNKCPVALKKCCTFVPFFIICN